MQLHKQVGSRLRQILGTSLEFHSMDAVTWLQVSEVVSSGQRIIVGIWNCGRKLKSRRRHGDHQPKDFLPLFENRNPSSTETVYHED